jgi:hypothetical protein
METPQHLFALTKPEQRVVLVIVLGLLFVAGFSRYRKEESAVPQPAPAQTATDSKPPADENSEEE